MNKMQVLSDSLATRNEFVYCFPPTGMQLSRSYCRLASTTSQTSYSYLKPLHATQFQNLLGLTFTLWNRL